MQQHLELTFLLGRDLVLSGSSLQAAGRNALLSVMKSVGFLQNLGKFVPDYTESHYSRQQYSVTAV